MAIQALLIEDNEHNRYLATFLLEKHGYAVTCTEDGFRGIELAKSGGFDIILIDIQLPGMDGYQVTHALRADPVTSKVPIVAITSYAMAGDREKAIAAGCDGYIEKPINPDTFVATISRFIKSK